MRLTKKDVAVLALASRGGGTDVIDTEDAAIAAHRIDPTAFGWKKYPDRVDLEVARTTLRHEGEAREPRIEGSVQNGWHLTPRGVDWVEANGPAAAEVTVSSTTAAAQRRRAETREVGAIVNRIRVSAAFRSWVRGQGFTARQAAEVFRIDEYTPVKDRSRKAARVQELAQGEADIQEFLKEAIPVALALTAPIGRQEREQLE